MYPLFLDLRDRSCLVVGGGAVGRRKAAGLLQAGARVRLVCLEPPTPLDAPAQPQWLQEPYRPDHLDGVVLVFAAATAAVNAQVAAEARARGIWANLADDPDGSDFHVPAIVRRGEFVLAVGTGGAAPALARAVRQRLEVEFDDAFGQWVELLAELRARAQQQGDARFQAALMERLTQWHWLERLRTEGVERVRQRMREEARALAAAPEPGL
jgi:siroheme synthase-like protein